MTGLNRAPLFASCILLAALIACVSEEEKAYHASLELVDSLTEVEAPVSPIQTESFVCPESPLVLTPGTNLVIDASRSMSGFAGNPGQVTMFDNVLDRLSVDWGIARVTLFGEQADGGAIYTQSSLDRGVHDPGAYTRLQNPDYCLIQALDSIQSGSVVAYLTDGVQSAVQFGNPAPTVRKLKEWLAKGRALEVVAFHSEFSGPAWSEQSKRWLGTARVPDRPFYAFVFALAQPELDNAMTKLSRSVLGSAERIRFPSEELSCVVKAEAHTSYPAPSEVAYSFVSTAVRNQFFSVSPDTVALYSCRFEEGYPSAALAAEMSLDYWQWNPGDASWTPAAPPRAAEFHSEIALQEGPGVVITAILPSTTSGAASRFGLYHLLLRPLPAELRHDITELSTESDADIANFDRTYRFDWLVEHLLRAHFKRIASPSSLFLTVQQDPR